MVVLTPGCQNRWIGPPHSVSSSAEHDLGFRTFVTAKRWEAYRYALVSWYASEIEQMFVDCYYFGCLFDLRDRYDQKYIIAPEVHLLKLT